MTVLVVQAHPVADSFNAAVLAEVLAGIHTTGVDPAVCRLGQGDSLQADLAVGVEHLVVIYPTWWGTTPALLLGPLHDLVAPWVDGDAPASGSPLRSLRRLTVVTTHGSSKFINVLQGEPGLHLWKRTIVPRVAPAARFDWVALYKVDQIDDAERRRFLDRVRSHFAAGESNDASAQRRHWAR